MLLRASCLLPMASLLDVLGPYRVGDIVRVLWLVGLRLVVAALNARDAMLR